MRGHVLSMGRRRGHFRIAMRVGQAERGVDRIVEALATRYGKPADTLESDVRACLALAEEAGVIAGTETPSEPGEPSFRAPAGAYEPPVLEKYEDMQEMLLLDPIHGLDEDGWPRSEDPAASPKS